jgi:L-gulonate 3-dehydrogenase
MDGAVADADLVLECAPEKLALKQQVFAELERLAPAEAVLASSSSMLKISDIAGALASRRRCLVLHPGNPPTLIRFIEVVPAPFTDAATLARVEDWLAAAGVAALRIGKEVEGFVFNRLQGAVLREAYCLVRDGVADVETIDTIMRDGLGLRWSVIGPFETVDLNTRGGIASHAEKMGPAYRRMGQERGQDDPWTPELVGAVTRQRRERLPLEGWAERVAWRDAELMRLVAARKGAR